MEISLKAALYENGAVSERLICSHVLKKFFKKNLIFFCKTDTSKKVQ